MLRGGDTSTATVVGVEAQEFPNEDTPLVEEGDIHLSMFAVDKEPVPNCWGKTVVDPIEALDIIEADEEDIVDDVGEADLTEKKLEALNDDEVAGNEDSELDEDSDNPAIGGFEFKVDAVSTHSDVLFVLADDAVIVHDNFKFGLIFVDTDVWDKSVGSEKIREKTT